MKAALPSREARGTRHGENRLNVASDHQPEPSRPRGHDNIQGRGDAGFHQFNINHLRGLRLHDPLDILHGAHAFVRRDGPSALFAERAHPSQIVFSEPLFQEHRRNPAVPQTADDRARMSAGEPGVAI